MHVVQAHTREVVCTKTEHVHSGMTNGLSLNDVAQIIKKKKKLQKVIPFTLYVGITKFSCKYSDANLNSRL